MASGFAFHSHLLRMIGYDGHQQRREQKQAVPGELSNSPDQVLFFLFFRCASNWHYARYAGVEKPVPSAKGSPQS
jgi:hypothetical protein